jgi:hypothetical protein
MRIASIKLSWFRGAADSAALDCSLKSMAVYGENAAGKSSFVDAIEYSIANGKIGHLSHEYSGSRQERGIINTHTPTGQNTTISIAFAKGGKSATTIQTSGASSSKGDVDLTKWSYARTVLRQDELASFIRSPKGEKYSALLPLLGLGHLEVAAENLRQISKSIENQAKLDQLVAAQSASARERRTLFGDSVDSEIAAQVDGIFAKYFAPDGTKTTQRKSVEILEEVGNRLQSLDATNRALLALRNLANEEIAPDATAIRAAEETLQASMEPLIREKLRLLEATSAYAASYLNGEDSLHCPACGQAIETDAFKGHVATELERLKEIDKTFKVRNDAIISLLSAVGRIKRHAASEALAAWIAGLRSGPLVAHLTWLEGFNVNRPEAFSIERDLSASESHCLGMIAAATEASAGSPPQLTELAEHKTLVEGARRIFEAAPLSGEIDGLTGAIQFLDVLQRNIREEIRAKSTAEIEAISGDVQAMWMILHPTAPIDQVRLYLPEDDKAIDIALCFHGKEQYSPRLTLSEGYRNSLGLCIFLALAKRETPNDRPVILDDVIVSFDRNHRGLLVELLQKEFAERQIIIFTHDRDWFADLRRQLDSSKWGFRALLPYDRPEIGIRWADNAGGFEAARAQINSRPDGACNDARKIMDVELSIVAEKLQLRLPYLRGERNDHRTGSDFLKRIMGDCPACFRKKEGDEYKASPDVVGLLDAADKLLMTWGNRGSHTQDVTRNEAIKLIDACESALSVFNCQQCTRKIWFTEAANPEFVQCSCGGLRWRYGKGS